MKGRGGNVRSGVIWPFLLFVLPIAVGRPAAAAGPEEIRVPLVALDGRGEAVPGLNRNGLEVFVNGRALPGFSLEKRGTASAPDRRTVFLVFDTLSTTHLWLSKARGIIEKFLEAPGPGTDFVLLTLEPGLGLRYVLGPSDDRSEVFQALRTKVVARRSGSGLDSDQRRFAREDGQLVGDPRDEQPRMGTLRTEVDPVSRRKTQLDEQKKADVFLTSLGTLGTALSGFQDSIKTIYFFSGGIATRTKYEDRSTTDPNAYAEVQTVDSLFLDTLTGLAETLKARGALLFVINPAGAQLGRQEPGSGDSQLELLAERAGGRYLEGEPETIVRSLTEMEAAFCDVILPLGAVGTDPLDIEIRPKDPGLRLLYTHRVLPARGFGSLTAEDKMRLAIDAAHDGEASRLALRLRRAEVLGRSEAGGRILYRLRLPEAFLDTPLEIYRVWLPRGSRTPSLEVERIGPAGGELSFAVAKKAGYRARVVIIEPRRAAGLIIP